MTKKYSYILMALMTIIALTASFQLFGLPSSWSSPAELFVTTSAPKILPSPGEPITLQGGGFSKNTRLWLAPERTTRSATTATLETFGAPIHIISRGDYLYVANSTGGFFILQGPHSPLPVITGILDSAGQGREITLLQNEVLMAAGSGGLQIIDIRDSSNPQLLSTLLSVSPAISVASTGHIAYVATGKFGAQIVDISDPRNPQHLGKIPGLPEAYRLLCDEKILIVATNNGGLLYDISQPSKPRYLSALPLSGRNNSIMTRHHDTLFWATRIPDGSRLYTVDLSSPNAPRLLSTTPLPSVPYGITCSDRHVAIALGSLGIQIFSLENGGNPVANLPIVAPIGIAHYALLDDNDLWVADREELLRIDLGMAADLSFKPFVPERCSTIQPIITSEHFILGDKHGLSIYLRTENSPPLLTAHLPISHLVQQYLSLNQNLLWLVTHESHPPFTTTLIKINLTNPLDPVITDEIPLADSTIIIGEQGPNLVISSSPRDIPRQMSSKDKLRNLSLIESSNPAPPSSAYLLENASNGFCLMDNYFVSIQTDGLLRVIDLSAAEGPAEAGVLQMPWIESAAWSGRVSIVNKDRRAFISSSLGTIYIIDLQDPKNPKNLGEIKLNNQITSLLIEGDYLLADVNKQGLVMINIQQTENPEILGNIPLSGIFHLGTVENGTFWYVTPSINGLNSLPLPKPIPCSVSGDNQIVATLAEEVPVGAYRLWLTDQQKHLLIPGFTKNHPR